MVTILTEVDTIPQAKLEPIETLDKLGQGLPTAAVRHFSKGIKLSEQRKFSEAVASYRRGIKFAPSVPQAWYNLGTALGELGRYTEALKAFERATELMPEYIDAYQNKGVALARLGRHEDALEAFERVLSHGAHDANALRSIGTVLFAQHKTEEALSTFRKALGHGGDNPLIRISIGLALSRLRRYADARKEYQKAYEVNKPESSLHVILYKAWTASTLSSGVIALLNEDITAFEEAGLEYIAVLEKAERDDAGEVVESILAQYKEQLQKKNQRKALKAFEELEIFIKLMKIKDPFEGWRALGKEMSKVWPEGLSAVEAVREMRR